MGNEREGVAGEYFVEDFGFWMCIGLEVIALGVWDLELCGFLGSQLIYDGHVYGSLW